MTQRYFVDTSPDCSTLVKTVQPTKGDGLAHFRHAAFVLYLGQIIHASE